MTRTREENAADLAHEASKTYRYTPETCPSKHWNDGSDTCEDCGADLNEAPQPLEPPRVFLVYSCNEHGEGLTVVRTIEEAEAKRCEDFETEEKPGSEAWNEEWVQAYQNSGWYCWEIEALNLETLEIEATSIREDGIVDWAKVAELVGWKDEDEDDEDEQPDPDELTHVGFEPVTIDVEDKEIEARLATFHDRMGRRWVSVEGRYYELTLPRIVRVRTDFGADAEGMIAAKEKKDAQADQ